MSRVLGQSVWQTCLAIIIAFSFLGVQHASASEEEGFDSPYLPSENVMAEVDATLASARANGKLALIVMGQPGAMTAGGSPPVSAAKTWAK